MKKAGRAAQLRVALPAARSRWQALATADYDLQVNGFVPLSCMLVARLKVRNNVLVAVEARRTPWDEQLPWEPVEPQHWTLPFCAYTQLTVTQMFDRVERDLAEADLAVDAVEVQFEPVYGFVTRYDHRAGYRQGLLNPAVSECCVWFAYSHFRRVDEK